VRRIAKILSVLGVLAVASPAAADPALRPHMGTPGFVSRLQEDENAALLRGETVTRDQTLERGDKRYVGGVTYTLVDATPDEIDALLDDMRAYQKVLPRTKQARLVGRNDADAYIELHQGNAIVDATYTLRVRRGRNEARFWLDATKPHAIADAWGFFRYEPVTDASGAPRVLLTYGVLVDLGPGLVRELFEDRVKVALLSVPRRLQVYVTENVRARAELW
jgi:hypothetical protein